MGAPRLPAIVLLAGACTSGDLVPDGGIVVDGASGIEDAETVRDTRSRGNDCTPSGDGALSDRSAVPESADALPAAADDLAFCVAENNRYRTMVAGRVALARSAALEAFAAEGARTDAAARTAHKHFRDTRGGGIAFAENELPGWGGWTLSRLGTVHDILAKGILVMWQEGPGGGHYENMTGTRYRELGCGIFIDGDRVTVTMDFH